jgi:hypothetical protein
MQERRIPILELIREEVLTSNSLRARQQCEVTMLGEDKNINGKRIPETVRKTQIIGKKERKLNKKKSKLENLHEVTWKTSQEAGLQDLHLVGTTELYIMGLHPDEAI